MIVTPAVSHQRLMKYQNSDIFTNATTPQKKSSTMYPTCPTNVQWTFLQGSAAGASCSGMLIQAHQIQTFDFSTSNSSLATYMYRDADEI